MLFIANSLLHIREEKHATNKMKSVTNGTNFPYLDEKEMGDGSISLLATLEMPSFRTKPESICFRKVVWKLV